MSHEVKRGRKYDQVVAGAREIFMQQGYEGASVDAIARAAGVSKATLYSYFADKRQLFLEIASCECQRQSEQAQALAQSGRTVRETLTDIAERLTGFVLSEFGQSVFRLCVAESERFPELGRAFYRSGPEQARRCIAEYFRNAVAAGDLDIDDCEFAAEQFTELCKAHLWTRLMFNMVSEVTPEEVDRIITAAVDMFLARYGTGSAR
ncbi:TetR/AcrR family transcriptional regulator [Poseidonocella sp. HB161398]|uniref:TetR/AcrR family transcriptional regulator n=1 Tax=Poseidonocella sp. HB161398 TaxID=2320855 RepID=UPI001108054D|nr:TetR/AcrR family transcriptional regulator [Poseidonocella sp. HB161398]